MSRILPIAVVILFCSLAIADEKVEPKPSLTLEADVTPEAKRFDNRVAVRLVNTGKTPVTVVTNKLRFRFTEGDKATIKFEMTEKRMHKERLVVPPADTLGLVKLMPGEVATVTVPAAPFQKALGKLGAKASVTVVYEVSEFWGKRFGAWHGKVEAKATIAKE